MARKRIVEVDFDEATYYGDEDDGVYVQVGRGPDGWYFSAVVDSTTGHFVDDLVIDDGPYPRKADAVSYGQGAAADWLLDNDVDWED